MYKYLKYKKLNEKIENLEDHIFFLSKRSKLANVLLNGFKQLEFKVESSSDSEEKLETLVNYGVTDYNIILDEIQEYVKNNVEIQYIEHVDKELVEADIWNKIKEDKIANLDKKYKNIFLSWLEDVIIEYSDSFINEYFSYIEDKYLNHEEYITMLENIKKDSYEEKDKLLKENYKPISIHEINNKYYFFYDLNKHSFHLPMSDMEIKQFISDDYLKYDLGEGKVGNIEDLKDFKIDHWNSDVNVKNKLIKNIKNEVKFQEYITFDNLIKLSEERNDYFHRIRY